jgi:hypothetical protein
MSLRDLCVCDEFMEHPWTKFTPQKVSSNVTMSQIMITITPNYKMMLNDIGVPVTFASIHESSTQRQPKQQS